MELSSPLQTGLVSSTLWPGSKDTDMPEEGETQQQGALPPNQHDRQASMEGDDDPSCKVHATTMLVGGSEFISQDAFLSAIIVPGADKKDVSEIFIFRKPRQRFERLNASSILKLSSKQHDVLYALSGCTDVMSVMSRITDQVRQAVDDIYGIDKCNLRTWFKNRGGAWRASSKPGDAKLKTRQGAADGSPPKYMRLCDGDEGSGGVALRGAMGLSHGVEPGSASTSSDQSNHAMDGQAHACHTSPASRADAVKEFASTRLVGSTEVITQDAFVAIIRAPGVAQKELSELFEFRRPRQSYKRANASTLLNLTSKQHDVLYALCGCSDVVSVASLVKQEVRDSVCEVYSIDKASLSIWFKNRRQIVRKPARGPPAGLGSSPTGDGQLRSMEGALIPSQLGSDDGLHAKLLQGLPRLTGAASVEPVWRSGSTKLLGGNDVIPQAVFALLIKSPGVARQELSELFVFIRPFARQYNIFPDLTSKQHDALFALAGCSDVTYSLSNIAPQVCLSVSEVYGISEAMLRTWFRCISEGQQSSDLGSSYLMPNIAAQQQQQQQQQTSLAIQPLLVAEQQQQQQQQTFSLSNCSFAVPCTTLDGVHRYVILPQSFDGGSADLLQAPLQLGQGQRLWADYAGGPTLPVEQHQRDRLALYGGGQNVGCDSSRLLNFSQVQQQQRVQAPGCMTALQEAHMLVQNMEPNPRRATLLSGPGILQGRR